jgi:hypothetical protein
MAGCSAIKPDGERCRGIATTGSDYCPAHDPSRSEARKRAASKAARTRHGGQGIGELKETLATLYQEVRSGMVEPKRGAVLNQILNARIRLVETEMRVREQQEILERLEQLEAIYAANNTGGIRGSWR